MSGKSDVIAVACFGTELLLADGDEAWVLD